MQQELLLRAIRNGIIGILITAILLILLIAHRKDIESGETGANSLTKAVTR